MLSNSVIILLREVLEAALLISILLAMSRQYQAARLWVLLGLVAGALGARAYAAQVPTLSQWFDGVGQEVVDASLQFAIAGLLPPCCYMFIRHYRGAMKSTTIFMALVATLIALSISREGSEIYLYISAFSMQPDHAQALYTGAAIGVGIGFSVGALFYYLLRSFPAAKRLVVGGGLLALVSAGMALQGCKMLIQADLLPDGSVWDSNAILSEHSVTGQLLYALAGYEASPAPVQLVAYGAALVISLVVQYLGWYPLAWRSSARVPR